MQIQADKSERGVRERSFVVAGALEAIPGVLFTPESAQGPRPLVLLGHGGLADKRAPYLVSLARRLVRHYGFASLAIDLPYHGERASALRLAPSRSDRSLAERLAALAPILAGREGDETARRAVDDWRRALAAVQALDDVGEEALGYFGLSMGTRFGVPLLDALPEIRAAVLGLFGWSDRRALAAFGEAVERLSIPVVLLAQWHDELAPRDTVLELFERLGSRRKQLIAHPGRHVQVPRAAYDVLEAFLHQQLGTPSAAGG